ncbi:cytochrome-c peroxidase [bacterium]|nr:cytochrome-c peroxidase [bacterium]
MKRISALMLLALVLWTGCDQPVEMNDLATVSEDAVAMRLTLPQEEVDYAANVAVAEQLISVNEPQLQIQQRRISNPRAALGRVLFYETQLSKNGTVSCASCHKQEQGFADSRQFSPGFDGGQTTRQAMSVANVRFYRSGRMFWDERAASLEEQALEPIQHPVEMGLTLEEAVQRVEQQPYYASLFTNAFGDDDVTEDRIGQALADFERSIVSVNSKYDLALASGLPNLGGNGAPGNGGLGIGGPPNGGPGNGGPGNGGPGNGGPGNGGPGNGAQGIGGPGQNGNGQNGGGNLGPVNAGQGTGLIQTANLVLSPQEEQGRRLFFSGRTQCSNCHRGNAFVGDIPRNNGLDLDTSTDEGAGGGRFKMASLRNIELTAPYMHDGRFESLLEVVEHYNSGIQAHPELDNRLKNRQGRPIRMNLTDQEKQALVAFMRTLTDNSLAVDERFSNPFLR